MLLTLTGKQSIKALIILTTIFSIWLMLVLLSFNAFDPSWAQTSLNESVHNFGGILGAWLSDTLFFIFGVIAYAIPIIIISSCWFIWQHQMNHDYIDYFGISLRLIGALMLISTSCMFADTNIDNIWCFTSGGVIGSLLNFTFSVQKDIVRTAILLCVLIEGLMLFTGLSWMNTLKKVASLTLNTFNFVRRKIYKKNTRNNLKV